LTFCLVSFLKRCTVHDERVRARCTTSIILTFTDHGRIPCTGHDKQNVAFTMHDRSKSPITLHDETPIATLYMVISYVEDIKSLLY